MAEDDTPRVAFLRACLQKLGLEVSQDESSIPSLSALHLSSLNRNEVGELLHSWDVIAEKKDGGEEVIKGEADTFRIQNPETKWSMAALSSAISDAVPAAVDYSAVPKHIIPHEEAWPEPKETPCFNHAVFYSSLREYREKERDAEEWGDALLYGEVVTSTNTLLEK